MRARLVSGLSGLVSVVVAGSALGYALLVAFGSGADDLVAIFGLTLNPAQRVLAATVVFGAALSWENATLRRRLFSHADAPYIAWLYPNAEMLADGTIHLQVQCENAGPRESEAVVMDTFAQSTVQGEKMCAPPVKVWSRILSRKNGLEHRFAVDIKSVAPESGRPHYGRREIQWGMFYFDGSNGADTNKGYVTAASIWVDFQSVGPAAINDEHQWLDATSTKEARHKRWRDKKFQPKRHDP